MNIKEGNHDPAAAGTNNDPARCEATSTSQTRQTGQMPDPPSPDPQQCDVAQPHKLWLYDVPDLPQRHDVVSPYEEPQDGFMYLRDAALWIASNRGALSREDATPHLEAAEYELVTYLEGGSFKAKGFKTRDFQASGEQMEIPDEVWGSVLRDLDRFDDRTTDPNCYVITYTPGEVHFPQRGPTDEVGSHQGWSSIRLRKRDIRKHWPQPYCLPASPIEQPVDVSATQAVGKRKRKPRARDPVEDTRLKADIKSVLASVHRIRKENPSWPDSWIAQKLFEDNKNAQKLLKNKKSQGFSVETLRQIVGGHYKPMRRLGISANASGDANSQK